MRVNIQQLRYVAEVARTQSISQAAKNLYMGQPNLSKAIKELEGELGISLFRRNARGVEPTGEGLQFLRHAREILDKMDALQSLYAPREEGGKRLEVSAPRATYIATAFARFMAEYAAGDEALEVQYKETHSMEVLEDVAGGRSALGVLRYQDIYEEHFLGLLAEHHLQHEHLWSFRMGLVMHKDHPLALLHNIPYLMLGKYPQLVHGDFQVPALPPERLENLQRVQQVQKRIYIYDRGSQFDLLRTVPGAYLWASPVPPEELSRHGLVQVRCTDAGVNKDVVIYPRRESLPPEGRRLIALLQAGVRALR
nr:LysR family transcriptional regulator [Clostridium sp. BSD2780061688b_171218_E8]